MNNPSNNKKTISRRKKFQEKLRGKKHYAQKMPKKLKK
jgi:hypothetical protein